MNQSARILTAVAVCSFVLAATSAFAQGPPVGGPGAGATTLITKAIPDFTNLDAPTITIFGVNFGSAPVVSVGDDVGTMMTLTTTSVSDTLIVADLPVAIVPGSYMLIVEAGTGATNTGILDITVGTAGPQGSPGVDGADGAPGAPGPQGPEGPAGTPNPHIITEGASTLNTAVGVNALLNNTASGNTAMGTGALFFNTTGGNNTAMGSRALNFNTTGGANTATGYFALPVNTTGGNNTAMGTGALGSNTTGDANTATGGGALKRNTAGFSNTATGVAALHLNDTGWFNTATGVNALRSNTIGTNNTAMGIGAMINNTSGGGNTAMGAGALNQNTTGRFNAGMGRNALSGNTTGDSNTAIGFGAGSLQTTGSHNIYVGHGGVAVESNTIRIGRPGTHTLTYISGITGTDVGASATVFVNAAGQLGTMMSSRRFKEKIRDMDGASNGLMELRPVMFRYTKEHAAGERCNPA